MSVRFFGRYWYVFTIYLLFNLMQLGISEKRLAQIKRHLEITVSESTWKRWRRWWRQVFVKEPFWQQAKGHLMPPPASWTSLTRDLLNRFEGMFVEKFIQLLKFLSPLTGGILRAV